MENGLERVWGWGGGGEVTDNESHETSEQMNVVLQKRSVPWTGMVAVELELIDQVERYFELV